MLISVLAHPMLLGAVFIVLLMFRLMPSRKAAAYSVLFVTILFVPVAYNNFKKARSGAYSDFDMRERTERSGFYIRSILLFVAAYVVSVLLHLHSSVSKGLAVAAGLMATGFLLNRFIKVSLHTAIVVFLAFGAWLLFGPFTGGCFFLFALLVGWSRYILNRHSTTEIILGFVLGTAAGLIIMYGV